MPSDTELAPRDAVAIPVPMESRADSINDGIRVRFQCAHGARHLLARPFTPLTLSGISCGYRLADGARPQGEHTEPAARPSVAVAYAMIDALD